MKFFLYYDNVFWLRLRKEQENYDYLKELMFYLLSINKDLYIHIFERPLKYVLVVRIGVYFTLDFGRESGCDSSSFLRKFADNFY